MGLGILKIEKERKLYKGRMGSFPRKIWRSFFKKNLSYKEREREREREEQNEEEEESQKKGEKEERGQNTFKQHLLKEKTASTSPFIATLTSSSGVFRKGIIIANSSPELKVIPV